MEAKALASYQRALKRSNERNAKVTSVSTDHYIVHSDSGNSYNVYIIRKAHSTVYECECLGFQFGHTCWHAAKIAALPQEIAIRFWSQENPNVDVNPLDIIPEIGLRYRCPPGYTLNFTPEIEE